MKHVLLLSVLLLGVSWAVAQNATTQPQSQDSSPTASQTATGQTTAGSKASVQGCLGGSDGNYTLTDKQGMTYNLTGDTSKLADHVGHEVKITGTTGGDSNASGAASGGGMSNSSQSINVTSVKHISKTCQNAGASK